MKDAWWVFAFWGLSMTGVAVWQQERFKRGLAEAKRLADELRHEMADQGDEDWSEFNDEGNPE